jgi:Tol biopolymer transport system component
MRTWRARFLVAGAVALAAAAGGSEAVTARTAATARNDVLVVAEVPAKASPSSLPGSLQPLPADGGRLVLVSGGRARVLTKGFHSAADPEVSFDGTKILFAGKQKKTDPWCIWEMNADGTAPRRITCGTAGARHPVYLTTVFTITPTDVEPWVQVAFVGEDGDERDETGAAPHTSLWSCKTDGTALRRLTFNLSNDVDPVILPDGRMVYAAWLQGSPAKEGEGRAAIVGVNEDGTDYQAYAGGGLRVKRAPAPTSTGLVVFVESDHAAMDGAGRLATVSQARPLHSYTSLTTAADGRFRAPSPLPDGRVLVAWRAETPQAPFAVHRFDPATGAHEPIFAEKGWHAVSARTVAARPVPDARSSVVRDDDPQATLFSVSVDIHDLGDALPAGTAKTLRVVEGVPAAPGRPAATRILGEIPIADDGSYQVKVPANTPVRLQTLDADGLVLRTSAWLWGRNHDAQGCVGCHEDPERSPPNRLMKALAAPPPVLDVPAGQRRAPGFSSVAPIVAARCMTCHAEHASAPRLDATAASLAPYVTVGAARTSPLVWHLLGRSTARPWDGAATKATVRPWPAGTVGPSAAEIRAFVEWIDLGGRP